MSGLFSRVLSFFGNLAEDAVDSGIDAAHAALKGDEYAYKHMLWQMREESGSDTDAWAGQAHDRELAENYATVNDLLDGRPKAATYKDRDNGEGPILWACFYGPLSLVERLASMGAKLRATSTDSVLIWYKKGGMQYIPKGCTTLMMAAAGGQTEIVRYLLEHGVPADAVAREAGNEKGHSALFMAARGLGSAEIVRLLADAGADPNLGEAIGFTPAGEAAARGAADVLGALVDAGADLSAPSGSKSVMELAGEADDPSAMGPLVKGMFGRVLTLADVTAALEGAGIEHEVVERLDVGTHGADLIRFMAVYAKIMDDDHGDAEDSPDFYMWAGRSWDEISSIDLEEWMEDMNIGSRRFGGDGEMKGLLGIAEGGLTPFARVNDTAGQVVFQSNGGEGHGKVALEAFDELRVVVLEAEDVKRAVAAFEKHVGPPPER